MSICDRCFAPGACCKQMWLTSSTHPDGITLWDDEDPIEQLVERDPALSVFRPLETVGTWTTDEGRSYSTRNFTCSALGSDGRCTVYEDRPQLCRSYEAASTHLCVHFNGSGAGDASVMA